MARLLEGVGEMIRATLWEWSRARGEHSVCCSERTKATAVVLTWTPVNTVRVATAITTLNIVQSDSYLTVF